MKICEGQKLRTGPILRRIQAQGGFSLIEMMVAVMVLMVGLMGVAGMQINAMRGVFLASSQTAGAGLSQAWLECFSGLISQREQEPNPSASFNNKYVLNNFLQLAALDATPDDDQYTVVHPDCTGGVCTNCKDPDTGKACITMPTTTAAMKKFFNDHNFTNAPPGGHTTFDDASILPPLPPASAYMVWRIADNVPAQNVITLQVSILYRNAFIVDKGATLTYIVGSTH